MGGGGGAIFLRFFSAKITLSRLETLILRQKCDDKRYPFVVSPHFSPFRTSNRSFEFRA